MFKVALLISMAARLGPSKQVVRRNRVGKHSSTRNHEANRRLRNCHIDKTKNRMRKAHRNVQPRPLNKRFWYATRPTSTPSAFWTLIWTKPGGGTCIVAWNRVQNQPFWDEDSRNCFTLNFKATAIMSQPSSKRPSLFRSTYHLNPFQPR